MLINAIGTTSVLGTKNIAVPGTLLGGSFLICDKNFFIFIDPSQRALSIRSLPLIQLNIIKMTAKAITIVTHPPSKNLNKVEEKNATSRINKIAKIGIKINLFQPLTKISKNVARIVSINIDPVTAIP